MHFFALSAALLPLTSFVAASPMIEKRAMSAHQMVLNINNITQQSAHLKPIASSINPGILGVVKRQSNPFEPLIDGFSAIIKTADADIRAMDGTKPFGTADAEKVCKAFSEFVVIHQQLLAIVIGKSGILEGIFLGPVAAVLRSLEGVVDTLAFGIIDAVPACKASATKNKNKLDVTLGKAVCAYTPGGTLGVDLFC